MKINFFVDPEKLRFRVSISLKSNIMAAAITYCSSVTNVINEREGKTLSECKIASPEDRAKAIAKLALCVKGFNESKIKLEDTDSFIGKKSISKVPR